MPSQQPSGDDDRSRRFVRRLTQRRGANFSLGFRLLPAEKRRAVYAAYAACRIPDDIVDEVRPGDDPSAIERRLDSWQRELDATYQGRPSEPTTRALAAVLERFPIPHAALSGLVEGCRMDLVKRRYATYAELERYCELVAVTISEISLAIFGALRSEASVLGRNLAMALQLTNVCRDVGEDVGRDRIYLPLDELARYGVEADEVLAGNVGTDRYRSLMTFQCDRARDHFRRANALPVCIERDARTAVRVMGGVYRRVLDGVARDPAAAYSGRVELSRWRRIEAIVAGVCGAVYVS